MKLKLPPRVFLGELSMRDGIQNEEIFIPTETKIFFINAFGEAGFSEVEAVSFANPKYVPQFRNVAEVLKGRSEHVQGNYHGGTDREHPHTHHESLPSDYARSNC